MSQTFMYSLGMVEDAKKNKKKRGFSAMAPEKQRAIASKGGKAAHAADAGGHEFTSAEAVEAGKKGGLKISQDRHHMSELGRKGGLARAAAMKLKKEEEKK